MTRQIPDITDTATEIYSVSQLTNEAREILEDSFSSVWVSGEISNLARPSSGHLYFSLKDERAQVRSAFFRHAAQRLKFMPENGLQVLVRARVSLYEARGDFQLIIQAMEPAGVGALQLAFEQLKERLSAEGLFNEVHKKEIPACPKSIGVVTSASGAAIRDILKVLQQRFPSIPVIIYPTLVQGDQAAENIASAIKKANARKECDVLIVARGGGSLEDLWPFNEERVARAIFKSEIPVVSGVGHEVDFTIADFVADHRAPTPSAAAEWVSPDQAEYQDNYNYLLQRLQQAITEQIKHLKAHLHHLRARLRHPGDRLREQAQRLDQLEQRLFLSLDNMLKQKKLAFNKASQFLETVSPLRTLDRGYAIVARSDDHKVLQHTDQLNVGDTIDITLSKGALQAIINKVIESQ